MKQIAMKQLSALALGASLLALTACSDSDDAQPEVQASAPAATATAPAQPTAPAGHPTMTPSQQQAIAEAQTMPNHGSVTEMMHASGYTYMNIDTGNGQSVWIAATMMRVKPGDQIQWGDAAVMHNFTSKSLHRDFDKILFVSNAVVTPNS